ncbi:MAG: ferrochelatase [Acidimicrobiaceae bacterium]|nr:ferrochelatase [Acidimicrobiaceae bacterium]
MNNSCYDDPYDAVLLVSFGGPEGPDDVEPFLLNVTAGRGIPRERLAAVAEQYLHFGGVSPINEQCRRLRAALARKLADSGCDLPVYWGNRNWRPLLSDTVAQMAEAGHRRALAVVTSAYSSYSGCRQYREDIAAARAAVGESAPVIDKVRAYYDHPGFVLPFADAVAAARERLDEEFRSGACLVFTAHSIPEAMAAACDYQQQLAETARLVARGAGFDSWTMAWQSRSGPPSVPWLEPDISDCLKQLSRERNAEAAVLAPIGFVTDHMEVMWDLDMVAASAAAESGMRLVRAATPGTEPDERFVDMWAELIRERLAPGVPRRSLGRLGVRPDVCPEDCCLRR